MVADWTREHDKQEAMSLIGAAGVPAGAVLDTMELMNEPSFTERGILQTATIPTGPFKMPAWPVRFDGPRQSSSRPRCWASTMPTCSAAGSA